MTQKQLPTTLTETRQARLARVLSLTAGKVRPASGMSFTPSRAIEAAAIAHQLPRGPQ